MAPQRLRLMIEQGLIDTAGVRSWADQRILASAESSDLDLRLSLIRSLPDALQTLTEAGVPGPSAEDMAWALGSLMTELQDGDISINNAIAAVMRLGGAHFERFPEVSLFSSIWSDELDDTEAGIFGTLESLRSDFLVALDKLILELRDRG